MLLANVAEGISLLVKIGAVVGAIVAIVRAWLWGADITYKLQRIITLLPRLEKIDPLIDTLAKEFRPNGGSSLSDKVRNIETVVMQTNRKAEEAAKKADQANEHLDTQDHSIAQIKLTVEQLAAKPPCTHRDESAK